jgi:hypothetical protein
MHRDMLLRHLAEAQDHIEIGARNIAKQREIVAGLDAHGRDTEEAYEMLKNFVHVHAMALADRKRIKQELAESEKQAPPRRT